MDYKEQVALLFKADEVITDWMAKMEALREKRPDLVESPYLPIPWSQFQGYIMDVKAAAYYYYKEHGIPTAPEVGVSGHPLVWGAYGLLAFMSLMFKMSVKHWADVMTAPEETNQAMWSFFSQADKEQREEIAAILENVTSLHDAKKPEGALDLWNVVSIGGVKISALDFILYPLAGWGAYKFVKEGVGLKLKKVAAIVLVVLLGTAQGTTKNEKGKKESLEAFIGISATILKRDYKHFEKSVFFAEEKVYKKEKKAVLKKIKKGDAEKVLKKMFHLEVEVHEGGNIRYVEMRTRFHMKKINGEWKAVYILCLDTGEECEYSLCEHDYDNCD